MQASISVPAEQVSREHWFSFGDGCLAVSERTPGGCASDPGFSRGQALFFLHGRFGHGGMWRPLVERLAHHYRCYHIDLPGFGGSFSVRGRGFSLPEQAQLLGGLVRRFAGARRKAVLVGHDTGGAIAQLCAIHDPEPVAGLVLINSATLTHEARDFKTGVLCLRARRKLRRLLAAVVDGLGSEETRMLSSAWESRLGRSQLAQAFRAWERSWPGPLERQLWRERLRELPRPVLLLWGRRDPLNPPAAAEELMRNLPEAYLFERDDCGHWPCLERTGWVDDKMREFLFRL